MCMLFGNIGLSGDDVAQPICHAIGNGINGGVRAVNANAVCEKEGHGELLCVFGGDGLEAAEDDGMVGDHDGVVVLDGLVGDGAGEVDG